MRLTKTLENQARNNFQYIKELVQTECCICLKCLVGKQGKLQPHSEGGVAKGPRNVETTITKTALRLMVNIASAVANVYSQ